MKQDRIIPHIHPGTALIEDTYRGLAPLVRDRRKVAGALDHLQKVADETSVEAIQKLRRRMRRFEPSVTLIGQVKAGKTSLVNAMSGGGTLLPSDVNPWTSVVTSLHLSPVLKEANQRAQFRFFAEDEWANLLNTGGRVGELASRAGADKELEKVRRQLSDMREKSRARLGASFEQLLGQAHEYGYVDEELIQRYVCLGDDFDLDTSAEKSQGRFADITKSADLYVSLPALPLPICLRDTPGVNDTFMVREQITVNAMRGSRLCVMVLSAHQALSTVDLALIRLISNIPTRDVVIFVNRVDELEDPAREIPEIRDSIRKTLAGQNVSTDTKIIFGSAVWAHRALTGELGALSKASASALINLAEYEATQTAPEKDPFAMVWTLSGLPALGQAIAERIVVGEGAEHVAAIASDARNIANAISASRAMADRRAVEGPAQPVDVAALTKALDRTSERVTDGLGSELDGLLDALDARLDKSRQTFVSRAVTSLIKHLEIYGEDEVWTYDPAGLRLLLKTGYQVFAAKASRAGEDGYLRCSNELKDLFLQSYSLSDVGFDLEPPAAPQPPAPVLLGQTIALDIKGSWWSRWWRKRRTYQAYAEEFRALIDAEIAPLVDALKADLATPYKAALMGKLDEFMVGQRAVFLNLASRDHSDLEDLRRKQADALDAQHSALTEARSLLTDFQGPEERKVPA